MKSQLTREFQGSYELTLTSEQLELDAEAQRAKEKKEKAQALHELKKEEARSGNSRPTTAPITDESSLSADGGGVLGENLLEIEEETKEEKTKEETKEERGKTEILIDDNSIIDVPSQPSQSSLQPTVSVAANDVEIIGDLKITRDSMKSVVLSQFDTGARATRLLACANEWLSVTPEMIIPTEIEEGDSEWNFAFLANLFIAHPTLRTDPVPFVTDYQEMNKLFRHKNYSFNLVNTGSRTINKTDSEDPSMLIKSLCTKVNKLSKRVNNRINMLQRSHLSWRETEIKVIQRLVQDLCKRARGIDSSQKDEESQKERDQFQKLSFLKLTDILQREEIDPKIEFERLKTYCGECFDDLRKIYSAYGALGGGGGSVSFYEFSSLVRDCKLVNKDWTQADITLVFVKTNIEIDEETGERINIDHNPDSALTTTEFVEILIRISHGMYKNRPLLEHEMTIENISNKTTVRSITQCMVTLMEENILPFAKRSDAEEFRKKLRIPIIKGVFTKYNERLEHIFEKYAKFDSEQNTGDESRADITMNMREFTKMCKDKQISIPHRKVMSVFQNVQNDDTAFADDDSMDAEVDFTEFQEAVAAIACIMFPDPYSPMEQRIEMLLLRNLLKNENKDSKKKKKKRTKGRK